VGVDVGGKEVKVSAAVTNGFSVGVAVAGRVAERVGGGVGVGGIVT